MEVVNDSALVAGWHELLARTLGPELPILSLALWEFRVLGFRVLGVSSEEGKGQWKRNRKL